MHVVQIEHAVSDYDTWKAAFDSDLAYRRASGVRRYEVFRPVGDPRYVAVDLEFETLTEARRSRPRSKACGGRPRRWPRSVERPKARIVDIVERHDY